MDSLKENFEDMEFHTLLNDDTNGPREKLGNRVLQKNRKLF